MPRTKPEFSVLIPTFNGRETLGLCLKRVRQQRWPMDRFEVILVVDGSSDGSLEMLKHLDPPFRMKVLEQPNRGRAAALNRAAEAARGTFLLIIDDDILPCPGFLAAHRAGLDRAQVVTGPIPLAPESPHCFLALGVQRWAEDHQARMASSSGSLNATDLYGANLSLRTGLFKELGGYREDLRRSEDYHLGHRILQAGCRVLFNPEAVAWQIYQKDFRAWCQDFYLDGRSHVKLIQEFPALKSRLKLHAYHRSETPAKRVLRPLVIRRHWAGTLILTAAEGLLEQARRAGLGWRVLSSCQGVIGDSHYFRGVYDELGGQGAFDALTGPA